MTDFEALLACYRSGQVSERQWQARLEDKAFREWVKAQEKEVADRQTAGAGTSDFDWINDPQVGR